MDKQLGNIIELSDEIRELYINYDFRYFIKKHMKSSNDFKKVEIIYKQHSEKLIAELKLNKKQFLYRIDGAVRKMHSGGFLPSIFELDETRKLTIFDTPEIGEYWACFELWRKFERRKFTKKKFSKSIIFWGSVLAYVLTIIKIIEYFKN